MNMFNRTLTCVLVMSALVTIVQGNGRLLVPPQRSSLWRDPAFYRNRYVFKNYDDHTLNCGGFWKMHENDGKCGLCGDPWDEEEPRPNEAGGIYGRGIIGRTYSTDKRFIDVVVQVTSSMGGYFEFNICPHNDVKTRVTKECLDEFPMRILSKDQTTSYGRRYVPDITAGRAGIVELALEIPEGMECTQCVLQWRWHGGNNYGICRNGQWAKGCGEQPEIYNCADIAILPDYKEEEPNGHKEIDMNGGRPWTPKPSTRKPEITTPKEKESGTTTVASRITTTAAPTTTVERTTSKPVTTITGKPVTTTTTTVERATGNPVTTTTFLPDIIISTNMPERVTTGKQEISTNKTLLVSTTERFTGKPITTTTLLPAIIISTKLPERVTTGKQEISTNETLLVSTTERATVKPITTTMLPDIITSTKMTERVTTDKQEISTNETTTVTLTNNATNGTTNTTQDTQASTSRQDITTRFSTPANTFAVNNDLTSLADMNTTVSSLLNSTTANKIETSTKQSEGQKEGETTSVFPLSSSTTVVPVTASEKQQTDTSTNDSRVVNKPSTVTLEIPFTQFMETSTIVSVTGVVKQQTNTSSNDTLAVNETTTVTPQTSSVQSPHPETIQELNITTNRNLVLTTNSVALQNSTTVPITTVSTPANETFESTIKFDESDLTTGQPTTIGVIQTNNQSMDSSSSQNNNHSTAAINLEESSTNTTTSFPPINLNENKTTVSPPSSTGKIIDLPINNEKQSLSIPQPNATLEQVTTKENLSPQTDVDSFFSPNISTILLSTEQPLVTAAVNATDLEMATQRVVVTTPFIATNTTKLSNSTPLVETTKDMGKVEVVSSVKPVSSENATSTKNTTTPNVNIQEKTPEGFGTTQQKLSTSSTVPLVTGSKLSTSTSTPTTSSTITFTTTENSLIRLLDDIANLADLKSNEILDFVNRTSGNNTSSVEDVKTMESSSKVNTTGNPTTAGPVSTTATDSSVFTSNTSISRTTRLARPTGGRFGGGINVATLFPVDNIVNIDLNIPGGDANAEKRTVPAN